MPTCDMLTYELRIGVTGHRNLPAEKLPQIEQAVEDTLLKVSDTLAAATAQPHGKHGTPRTFLQGCDRLLVKGFRCLGLMARSPDRVLTERQTLVDWTVVSPLAKGADRLVARTVLDKLRARSAHPPRLEVILPLPVDEYRKDFDTAADLEQFNTLYDIADRHHTVVTLNRDFNQQTHADPKAARQKAYEDVGRAVVDSCEIIIVVWNGKPANGRGGTEEILAYAVRSARLVLWIDAENPTQPAQVVIPQSTKKPDRDGNLKYDFEAFPLSAKRLSPGFHRLSGYQRDPLHDLVQEGEHDWVAAREQAAAGNAEVLAALKTIDTALLPHYSRTDALAVNYQTLYFKAVRAVYACSVAAVGVVAFQVLFFPHETWLIALEIAAMLAAGLLVRVSSCEQWKEKWQHDRHLAEWLRRQHYIWLLHDDLAKMYERVIDPRPYPGAEEWFERAFRPLFTRLRKEIKTPLPCDPVRRVIVDTWIGAQVTWHHKQIERKKEAAHQAHQYNWWIFGATLIFAGLHIAGFGHNPDPHAPPGILAQAITFMAIVLPAVGAAVHASTSLRDYERLAARSKQMEPVLTALMLKADSTVTHEELALVVAEANHLMAQENDDWWVSLGGQAPLMPV